MRRYGCGLRGRSVSDRGRTWQQIAAVRAEAAGGRGDILAAVWAWSHGSVPLADLGAMHGTLLAVWRAARLGSTAVRDTHGPRAAEGHGPTKRARGRARHRAPRPVR